MPMFRVILESKRTVLAVYKGYQLGIYDSWLKAKYQVSGVSRSCHKKFSTFYDVDNFAEDCTFKAQMTNWKM